MGVHLPLGVRQAAVAQLTFPCMGLQIQQLGTPLPTSIRELLLLVAAVAFMVKITLAAHTSETTAEDILHPLLLQTIIQ